MTSMGEGSSNQGDVHEGLNFAAIHKLPFIFVVENNGYAISVPMARQVSSPERGRSRRRLRHPGRDRRRHRRPGLLRGGARRGRPRPGRRGPDPHRGQGHPPDRPFLGRPADEVPLRGGAGRRARARPACRPSAAQLRDAGVLDRRDRGAADGRDQGRRRRGDRLRRGRSPTPTRPPPCATSTPRTPSTMPARTFIEAIRETLADEMRRDESIIVLGEDVGKKGGVFLATDGLWAEFGDDRVIDTPLTESMIIGASDRRGRERPAADRRDPVRRLHLPGVQPDRVRGGPDALSLEQRLRRADGDPRPVRRRRPRRALPLAERRGVLHPRARAQGRRSRRRPYDARGLLRSSIRDDDPVLFFEHKKMYRSVRGDVPDTDYTVPLGKAAVTHPGSQVTVIAYGLMAHYALEAADRVADDGISVEVVDLRTLRPLDTRDRPRVGPQDRQVPDRLRGQPVRRVRRGGRGDRRRGGVRLPRRAGHPHRRPGRPGRALQPRPRGLVHGHAREDRGRASASSRRTDGEARSGVAADEFGLLFERFKTMLAPYARACTSRATDRRCTASTWLPRASATRRPGSPGTRLGKRYVSYYLMPVYVQPSLLDDISPELRRRMQGKSCFNFAKVDEPLLAELEALTKKSYEATGGDPRWGAAQRELRRRHSLVDAVPPGSLPRLGVGPG